MRDILICLTAVLMLGGGLSIGRHYGASQESAPALQASEPEKIMVGPDGVAFVRRSLAKPTVVSESRPVAPAFDDLTKQVKALEMPVVETEMLPSPAIVVATIPMKSAGAMVGPDGVVYQHVRKEVR